MSFTAEVKDELSRIDGPTIECATAQLSALVRVCGTLSFHGSGSYSVRIATETGAVARTVIKLTHTVFNLDTSLTVRHSVLHKTRNYLIELKPQPGIEEALREMGILVPGRGLTPGISSRLVAPKGAADAYLRGAFMAGGFIANPRGDFHLEIAVTGESLADDIVELCAQAGIMARLNHRRGAFAVYLKSFDDIAALLVRMGARRTALAVNNVRQLKSVKNNVNRRVNAEMANQVRASDASLDQIRLIERIESERGLASLPSSLRTFCEIRKANPDLSLRDLGAVFDPPLSKSAVYHRLLRLEQLVDDESSDQTT